MDNDIQGYINSQPKDWQKILSDIHELIIKHDKTVTPVIEPMMGKEMILYKGKTLMKYGLSGGKNYMSLHVLPMYMNPAIYDRFKEKLNHASFQKGCINFTSAEQMPLKEITNLITVCAAVDLEKIREDQLKERKAAKKKKP